jgi:transcriptional regulator with XRE-family HTH domain
MNRNGTARPPTSRAFRGSKAAIQPCGETTKLTYKSQKSLGRQTGVTFQQVQKYENGLTRVSASRLQQIASVFEVSPAFFFEGVPTIPGDRRRSAPVASYVSEFLSTVEGLELVRAFMRIKSKDLRWAVVALVDQMAPEKN